VFENDIILGAYLGDFFARARPRRKKYRPLHAFVHKACPEAACDITNCKTKSNSGAQGLQNESLLTRNGGLGDRSSEMGDTLILNDPTTSYRDYLCFVSMCPGFQTSFTKQQLVKHMLRQKPLETLFPSLGKKESTHLAQSYV